MQMFRLLLLGDDWADCAGIWCAIRVPLVVVHAVVTGGVSLHVRTCTQRFCISKMARPISLVSRQSALARSSPNMASYWLKWS